MSMSTGPIDRRPISRRLALPLVVVVGLGVGFAGSWAWQEFFAEIGALELPSYCPDTASRSPMVRIVGGTFRMGSENFRAEEAPIREVTVGPFWIDRHHVTNAEFRRFVEATGYVTRAEQAGGGSYVFARPKEIHDLRDQSQWWIFVTGANWRRPTGPNSALAPAMDRHPVVHVSPDDAEAYATWRGHRLPTEAEWEYAARGGLDGADYAWGPEKDDARAPRANVWRGVFPHFNRNRGDKIGTTPVGCYEANGYGLHDMAGNVWQWTADPWRTEDDAARARVIKGGSFLCAENFCLRYRPAARQPGDASSGASHIGFRTVKD